MSERSSRQTWKRSFSSSVAGVLLVLSWLSGCDLIESPAAQRGGSTSAALYAARAAASVDSARAYSDSIATVRKTDSVRTLTARSKWRSDSGKDAKIQNDLKVLRAKDSLKIIKTRTADSLRKAKHHRADSAQYAKDSIAGAKVLAAIEKKYATKMAKDTASYFKAKAAGEARITKDSSALVAIRTTKYAKKLTSDSAAVNSAQALVDAETDSTSAKVKTAHATRLAKAKAALQRTLDAQTKAIASAQAKLTKDSLSHLANLASHSAKLAANPGLLATKYTKDSMAIAARLTKDRSKWDTRQSDDSTRLAGNVVTNAAKWAKDTADMAAAELVAKARKSADSLAIVSADSQLVVSRGLVVFTPGASAFSTPTTVSLGSTFTSQVGGKIYYTTDGTTPTASSTLYSGAIPVDSGMVIKAIAVRTGYANATVIGAEYTVGTTASPTFLPAAGTYTGSQSVVVTTTDSATIHYTLNGATPTTKSAAITTYGGAIVVDSTQTLKVLAVRRGKAPASVASAAYSIRVNPPTISPEEDSTAYDSLIVGLSTDDTLATIHYTMDGSAPTTSSPTMASGSTIKLKSSRTIKAICSRNHFANSEVVTVNDTIQVTPVEFSVPEGVIDTSLDIMDSLWTTTPSAKIYYTIDGSEPTTLSTLFTVPFRLSNAMTVRAIAVKPNLKNSTESSAEYTLPAAPEEPLPE